MLTPFQFKSLLSMTNFWFICRTDDLTESLESEMQRAFESIKLGQNSEYDLETTESLEAAHNDSQSINETHFETPVSSKVEAISKQANGHSPYIPISNNIENENQPPSSQDQTNGVATNQSTIKRFLDRDEVRVMQKVLGNEVLIYITILNSISNFFCIKGQPKRRRMCADSRHY